MYLFECIFHGDSECSKFQISLNFVNFWRLSSAHACRVERVKRLNRKSKSVGNVTPFIGRDSMNKRRIGSIREQHGDQAGFTRETDLPSFD